MILKVHYHLHLLKSGTLYYKKRTISIFSVNRISPINKVIQLPFAFKHFVVFDFDIFHIEIVYISCTIISKNSFQNTVEKELHSFFVREKLVSCRKKLIQKSAETYFGVCHLKTHINCNLY